MRTPITGSRLFPAVIVLALLACAIVLGACGEKEDTLGPKGRTEVSLMLDFFPNADHAGIYAAQAGGCLLYTSPSPRDRS